MNEERERIRQLGFKCDVLTMDGLIKSKKATQRPKDQLHIAELEELLKLQKEKQ